MSCHWVYLQLALQSASELLTLALFFSLCSNMDLPESMQDRTYKKNRGRGQRTLLYIPAVGHISRAIQFQKRNFSSLKIKRDLEEVCSKPISMVTTKINPNPDIVMEFQNDVFADIDLMRSQWGALFTTTPSQPIILTKAPIMNELMFHITHNTDTGLYSNGAVKMLLHYIMRLGSAEDLLSPWHSSYYARISTTTDPTSDKCGLPVLNNLAKKEDALNGKHASHAY